MNPAAKTDPPPRRQAAARLPLRSVASGRDSASAWDRNDAVAGEQGAAGGIPAFREPSHDRSSSASSRGDGQGRSSSAESLDRRLAVVAGRDAYCRFVQGALARPFLSQQAWRRLGFVRLSDFARERLGICGRSLEDDARIANALESLPHLSSAFLGGTLSWSQLRLLTRVARLHDEKEWIRRAAGLGLRELEGLVSSAPGGAGDTDAKEQTVAWSVRVSREGRRLWRAAVELAQRSAGEPLSTAKALELVVAEASSSRAACTPRTRQEPAADAAVLERLRALLANTAAGSDTTSCVVEPPAVQPLYDGSPEDLAIRDPELAAFLAECAREDAERARNEAEGGQHDAADAIAADVVTDFHARLEKLRTTVAEATGFGWFARSPDGDSWEPLPFDALERCDPRQLDARLREVRAAIQRLDGELAELLCEAADWRIYRELGFGNLEDYVRARVDVCPSTAWSLLALERQTRRSCPLLGAAWKEGRLSTLAARELLPVVGLRHGKSWIERARCVTLRRLKEEVNWTLERRDAGICGDDSPPPEDDQDLSDTLLKNLTTDQLQMRSQDVKQTTARGAVQIRVFLPVSVAILVEESLLALRQGSEPRGRVFERMIALAMLEWLTVPPHRDPIFERDGWRCAVPACTSRCNLHDHHVVFRSLGGGGEQTNRVTVCAAHHLHEIHTGRIRATGEAPHDIVWEMPFGRLRGDRYLGDHPDESN